MNDHAGTQFLQTVFEKVKETKKAILVMGPSNTAKSTIVSLFLGKQLKVIYDEELGEARIAHAVDGEKPEILELWG
jgi:predicted AAA+ superfamily ATPase